MYLLLKCLYLKIIKSGCKEKNKKCHGHCYPFVHLYVGYNKIIYDTGV